MTQIASNAFGLRLAQAADIPFIMETERTPGFEKLVGRWSETDHRAALAATGYAYLLATDGAQKPGAFAIVRDIDDAHGNVCLKRIAVTAPGQGVMRNAYKLPDESRIDLVLTSLLRPEWTATR